MHFFLDGPIESLLGACRAWSVFEVFATMNCICVFFTRLTKYRETKV